MTDGKRRTDRLQWVKALSGTAFAGVELLAIRGRSRRGQRFAGALSAPEEGVYAAEAVVAFEPAETELELENELEAPGARAPDDALACRYNQATACLGSF